MAVVVVFLVIGLVIAVAAVVVIREAGRIAHAPPPALFDVDEAYEWVIAHLPDIVAATLTAADVRRILDFELEYFEHEGVSAGNGAALSRTTPILVGDSETVAYVLDRAAATGEAYLPEQVYAVIETQLAYLRAIGAVGPAVADDGGTSPA